MIDPGLEKQLDSLVDRAHEFRHEYDLRGTPDSWKHCATAIGHIQQAERRRLRAKMIADIEAAHAEFDAAFGSLKAPAA